MNFSPPTSRSWNPSGKGGQYASEEKLPRVRHALAVDFLGGDALRIRSGSDLSQGGEVVTFHDFSVIGLLPPFSDFFLAILDMRT